METKNEKPLKDDGQLHKGKDCIGCKYIIDPKCKGKPRHVTRCLNYEERIKSNG